MAAEQQGVEQEKARAKAQEAKEQVSKHISTHCRQHRARAFLTAGPCPCQLTQCVRRCWRLCPIAALLDRQVAEAPMRA